jgi:hypothetical protein
MEPRSIIYQRVGIYRAVMNVLYGGKYKQRFEPVISELANLPKESKVLELCFGDTFIAAACQKAGHSWLGLDLNTRFIQHAKSLGFDARYGNLLTLPSLPRADVCIMLGSFYHFHKYAIEILRKMIDAAPVIIFSEPVLNLSSQKGLLGFIAKRAGNAGNGDEAFRYNKQSFMKVLEDASQDLKFSIEEIAEFKKDIIIKIKRHE